MNTLVIGCGNLLLGDDGVGPSLIHQLAQLGLPPGMRVVDCGTAGTDVALKMRGADQVIVIDAARSGVPPGTLYRVPSRELETLPPLQGINRHTFRWDHVLAFGRWLLKDEYPRNITVYLIEGEHFEHGAALSPAVQARMEQLASRLIAETAAQATWAIT